MFDFNIKSTKIKLDNSLPDKRFWQAVALDTVRNIRERTGKGTDVDGQSFKPYSKQYAKFRQKHGRGTTPDLTYSGRMLGAMRTIAEKMGAKIRITGDDGFKAWQTNEDREFFNLSEKEIDTIAKDALEWMEKNILK